MIGLDVKNAAQQCIYFINMGLRICPESTDAEGVWPRVFCNKVPIQQRGGCVLTLHCDYSLSLISVLQETNKKNMVNLSYLHGAQL